MTEGTKPEGEPKIIVDDDWKSQVEKEKEELQKQTEAPSDSQSQAESPLDMPPASFLVLLSTLATQAMAALGLVADPATGKPNVNRPIAKHFIDTMAMLQEKTKGNLTEEEAAHLRDGLHQLRMIYVSTQDMPSNETDSEPDSEPDKTSTLELP